jgi:hypothetical protein
VRQHVAPVGHGEGEFHMLLDQQHAAAALLGVFAHHGEQSLDDDRREPEAELVDQQQLRLPGQGPPGRRRTIAPSASLRLHLVLPALGPAARRDTELI